MGQAKLWRIKTCKFKFPERQRYKEEIRNDKKHMNSMKMVTDNYYYVVCWQ